MARSAGSTHPQPSPATGRPDGLALSSDAEVLAARHHRDGLVRAAADIVAACGHDPDVADCIAARCHLADLADGPAICAVAHDLAMLDGVPMFRRPPSAAEAVAEFRARLVAAADAIRHCRQSEHGAGGCWFSHATGADGCRTVLHLLHATC